MKKYLFLCLTALMMLITMTGNAQSSCTSPTGLSASLHAPEWNNIQLNWNGIVDTDEVTIQYADSYTTRIGMNAAADFIGAVRFTPTELSEHAGKYLSAVSFVPGENQTTCTFSIRVWTGGSLVDTVFDPGTLVVDQVVTAPLTLYGLNTIMLETPVLIDATQELWIGIRCNTSAGYPLGGENNTAVFNHGDLITEDGINWETLSGGDPTADIAAYNWVIIGHLQDPANLLSGYNVYRDGNLLTSASATSYLDSVDFGTYLYGITAEYASGCESDPINLTVTMAENPCFNCLDTASIGNGTNGQYYLPIGTYYNYSFTEQLYLASELGQIDGTIPCIAFQYIYSTPQDKDIVIYMGNTSKSSFSNGSDWISVSNMQQVFNGTVNFNTNDPDGWVNIPLDFAFEYDGSSNIVIAVLNNSGSYLNSSNTFNTHSASGKSIYVQQDGSAYNVNSLPSGSSYSYRNNIRFLIGEPVSCGMPAALTVTDVTTTSAVISWAYNEDHSGYELTLVPAGSIFDDETTIQLNDTAYEALDLNPNTEYTIWLRAVCPSGTSSYCMGSFHTVCIPETELPYSVNFDGFGSGSGIIPDCWEAAIAPSSNPSYPYIATTYHHSGTGSLYFYSYSPSHASVRGQGLDLTENTDPLIMSFWEYIATSYYGRMTVGYMTDPLDFNTFVPVKEVYPEDLSVGAWTEFKFALPESVNGQVIYPTFYSPYTPGSYSNYIYLDDVTIEVGNPECIAPSSFSVDNVSYSSALVSWTPVATELDHTLECTNLATEVTSTITMTAGMTSYMLSGLDTTTSYSLKLYPNCDDVPDTLFAQFNTLNGSIVSCLDPDTAAHEITAGSTSTSYNIPVNNFYNYTYSQQIFTPYELGGATVITGMAIDYAYSSPSTSKGNVTVYLAHRADSTFASTTDWTPINQAVKVYEGPMNCTNGWNTFEFDTYFPYNGINNLVLIVDDHSGDYDGSSYTFNVHTKVSGQYTTMYVYNDGSAYDPANPPTGSRYSIRNNIRFYGCNQSLSEPISCYPPNVLVTDYDSTSISLSWVAGGNETTWALQYREEGGSTWYSENDITGTTTYTISDLTPNTFYEIRMCGLCSNADSSEWTNLSAFTICEEVTVPYFEDFESATGTGQTAMAPCWFRGTNSSTQYPYIVSTYATSGSKSLYFYGGTSYYSYAASPRFESDIEMDSLIVKFNVLATSASYYLEVGIMSDPTDYSTFEVLASCTPSVAGIWQNFEISTANYTGNGHYLAFRVPVWGYSYPYLDDVQVDYIMPCSHPVDVTLLSVGTEEATIGWTAGGEETEWEYVYGPAGTVDLVSDPAEGATDNFATISNLTDNTVYDFYVRAVCSGFDVSAWEHFSFRTECLPIDQLPYTCNFDSMVTTTANSSSGLNNLTDCWDGLTTGSSYTSYPYVYYGSSYANSGNYSLRFYSYYSGDYGDQYAFLPPIDVDVLSWDNLLLEFNMINGSTSAPFTLVVGVTEGTDISTFVAVDTISQSATSYATQSVGFSNYEGNGNRIAIVNPQPSTSYSYGQIDDIMLSAPTCMHPNHLESTNADTNSITLTWNERGTATEWNIEYGPVGFTQGNGTTITVTTNPYTVTGLTHTSTYDFYVQSNCSNSEQSLWSSVTTASTTMLPTALPYSTDFSDATEAWILNNGNCPNYWVMGSYNGNSALFITDNGTTPNYANSSSTVAAQKLFTVGSTAEITINFDIIVNGESSYDYFKLFLAPATASFPAFTATPTSSDYSYNGYSQYAYQFGTNSSYPCILNQVSGGTHISAIMPNPNTNPDENSTALLVLVWKNDNSVSNQPPAIIQNLMVGEITCTQPTNLTVTNIGQTSADVSWTAGSDETAWTLEYKETSATTWTTVPVSTTSYQLTGLTGLTQYQVRVQANCAADDASLFTSTSFGTEGCEVADQCTYTFNLNDSYGDGWNGGALTITQNGVTITTLELTSGSSATETVNLCDNVSTSLVWTYGNYDYEAGFSIAGPDGTVIFSHDSMDTYTTFTFTTDCSGSGPVITDPTVATNAATAIGQTAATLNATITNPSSVTITAKGFEWKTTTGGTYTQIAGTGTGNSFTADLSGLTAGTNYTFKAFITFNGTTVYGDELTFTTQQQGQPTEPSATTADATNVTYNSATLNGSIANPDNVTITAQGFEWKATGAATYTTVNATGATMTYNLTGLNASTDYTYRAFVTTANGTHYGQDKTFTTGAEPVEPCDVPTGLTATDIQSESITISWDNAAVLRWNVQYSAQGGTLSSATATTNSYTITNLTPETTYQIQVQAVCEEDNMSEWSQAITATTLVGINSYLENNVTLYPNPAKEFVDVRIDGDINVIGMEVYDVYGKLINTINVVDNMTHINVSGMANGMYFVRVTTEQGMVTKRFVKK